MKWSGPEPGATSNILTFDFVFTAPQSQTRIDKLKTQIKHDPVQDLKAVRGSFQPDLN